MKAVEHPALALKERKPVPLQGGADLAAWRADVLQAMASVPLSRVYRRAFERWKRLVASVGSSRSWTARCAGRLLVGAGGATVLESGLALHHTYGVPYVPGSALKGLCAHYAAEVLEGEDWRGPVEGQRQGDAHRLAFGTTGEMGLLSFLDAWLVPEDSPGLTADVLTPHHPEYYRGDKGYWPADWDGPIPWSLLSVEGAFLFAIDSPPDDRAQRLRDVVTDSIALPALREWGIGAKTAAGYGRFTD